MVLLDNMWDDVLAGPQPHRGLGKLRKITTKQPLPIRDDGEGKWYHRSLSIPNSPGETSTPLTPTTPSPTGRKENVWRSVFHPGSNLATKRIGADLFDKPQPNSPTVYDCALVDAMTGFTVRRPGANIAEWVAAGYQPRGRAALVNQGCM